MSKSNLSNILSTTWAIVKSQADAGVPLLAIEQGNSGTYDLIVTNGVVGMHYEMVDTDADYSEFTTTYLPIANSPGATFGTDPDTKVRQRVNTALTVDLEGV